MSQRRIKGKAMLTVRAASSICPTAFIALCLLAACNGTQPEDLTPSLRYGAGASGCADFMVVHQSAGGDEYLVVTVRREQLGVGVSPRSFDLSIANGGYEVGIDMYTRRPNSPRYCNDALDGTDPRPATWKAVNGTLTASISTPDPADNELYKATVSLDSVTFQSPDGKRQIYLQHLTFDKVTVGWLPG